MSSLLPLLLSENLTALPAQIDLNSAFKDRDACFIVEDLSSGKKQVEHSPARCSKQVPPQSSFKFAAAIMGFESGILNDVDQVIKWDGTKHSRAEDNRDQTPKSWLSNSSIWVTRWLMPQIGLNQITAYLSNFNYGNKDFSGGMDKAWVSSSLKISGYEQLDFLKRFWQGKLAIKKKTYDLSKDVFFIKKYPNGAILYGKTGTGCLEGESCMSQPDKMLGWFIGAVENGGSIHIFVANAADLVPQSQPAGPRMRETVISLLEKMNILK
jgi:beta-lactamase class D